MQGVENFIGYCREYLEKRWHRINTIAKANLDDALENKFKDLKTKIIDCLKSSTKSYHYVLPTQLLSKTVEHSLDCRSLQVSYGKPGAFDARSIAHKVIVPFDKKNHNVLGGSAEPYVNNPLRCPSVTLDNEAKQKNSEFTSGQNVYISNLIDFAFSILILFGEEGRVRFLRRIGLELDRVNSSIYHRKTWAKLLRES